jgi:hypothetical protein
LRFLTASALNKLELCVSLSLFGDETPMLVHQEKPLVPSNSQMRTGASFGAQLDWLQTKKQQTEYLERD